MASKAFIQFKTADSARKALDIMNEKRVDGMQWKIFPAKIEDLQRIKE